MSGELGHLLTTFVDDEGRHADGIAPDMTVEVRHLQRVIARNRTMRVGTISLGIAAVLVGGVVGANALVGLDASPPANVGPLPTPASAIPMPSVAPVTDAMTCTDFGDVLTIISNTDIAFSEGRMDEIEQQGWDRLAMRVLGRISTSGEGAVSDAISALKQSAPATRYVGESKFDTTEFLSAAGELHSACADAGTGLSIEGFTGG